MDILVLGALEEEVRGILLAMKDTSAIKVGAFEVNKGKLFSHNILLCKCGVGKVHAAAAASAVLTVFPSVKRVINTGVAGGIGGEIKRGDIALGIRTVQHDFDSTADGKRKGQIEGFDSEFFAGDEEMISVMKKALESEHIRYVAGTIATGDQFIASDEKANSLWNEFGAIACEMESAAIAQVCALFKVPFIAMRAISDNGGNEAVGSFYEFLTHAANVNARAIIAFARLESE